MPEKPCTQMTRQLLLLLLQTCIVPMVVAVRPLPEQRGNTIYSASTHYARPAYTEYAKMARWLVHVNNWATVSTIQATSGLPSGGVASFADGPPEQATGRLLFYLTPMDEVARDVQANPACAITIAEEQLHPLGCGGTDPEDPTCAKLTAYGELRQVPPEEQEEARRLLFSRHPAMADWPAGHQFALHELALSHVALLDWYGGLHSISASDYWSAQLDPVQ